MKKYIVILLLVACFIFSGFGQVTRSYLDSIQCSYKSIPGKYKNGSFFYNMFDSVYRSRKYYYEGDYFCDGQGIIKLLSSKDGAEAFYGERRTYGIFDTLGNVLIPCVYDDLEPLTNCRNSSNDNNLYYKYYIFEKEDTIGVIKTGGEILYSFKRKLLTIDTGFFSGKLYFNYKILSNKYYSDYFTYKYNEDKVGIVSMLKGKRILPPEYDKITVYRDYAICRKNDSVFAFDLKNEKISKAYKDIWLSNDQKVFIIKPMFNNLYMACNNIFDVNNSRNYTFNRDSLVSYYDREAIVIENGKYGVIDNDGQPIIPFKYEDIYIIDNFLEIEMYWVKKDGLWAIINKKNSLLTGFDFVDVEKYNQINFDNLMYYAKPDTSESAYKKSYYRYKERRYYNGQDILNIVARELAIRINSHVIQKQSYEYFTAKKKDGYHVIRFFYNDINYSRYFKDLYVYPQTWDNIYMFGENLMNGLIGVKKGDKFGYVDYRLYEYYGIGNEIIYDGLIYLPDFYNSDNYIPCGVIKKNKFYYFEGYSKFDGKFIGKPKRYKN